MGYDVYRDGAFIGSTTTARTFAVVGLVPSTTYRMTVTAHDKAGGVSPASNALSVTTPTDTTAPTRPADLAAINITTTSITLTLAGSTDNVGVTGYNVYRSGVLLSSFLNTTVEVTGLVPDSMNNITVRAKDAAGNLSAASVVLSVRMLADAPSVPTGLAVTKIKPSSFILGWTVSTGGTGGIAGYEVYLNGVLAGTPTRRTLAISGLSPQNTYALTMRSFDSAGNRSAISAPLIVATTADTTRPTVPKNLSAANVTDQSFTLTWTASTDNVGGVGYDIYRNNVLIGQSFTPVFAVVSLTPLTTYQMKVKSRDAAGNQSAFSTVLTITTSARPNVAPTITLNTPARGSVFTLPFTLTFSVTATDSDGSIAKVEFYDGENKLGETFIPTAPDAFTFTLASGLPAGPHTLSVRATDNRNATTDSAPVMLTVDNPNSFPTVVLAGPVAGCAPAYLTLSADASDADGTIAKVEFYEGANLLGEILTPTTAPATYGFPLTLFSAGTYALTAVATDNSGAQASSGLVVMVVPFGPAALPFVANFEATEGYRPGALNGQLSWFATGGVTVVPSLALAAQQELVIPAAQPMEIFSHDFAAEGVSPVFVDFLAQPVAGADLASAIVFSTPAAQVALVGTASPAQLKLFDGAGLGWRGTGKTVPTDPNGQTLAQIRLTTREDYLTKKWDLYLDGRMIAGDVAFADASATALTDFSVNGHVTVASGFDHFYAGPENPLFADTNRNGLPDDWETAHGLLLANDNRQFSSSGNGVTILQAYLTGTDPNDFYNGIAPVITVLVGDNGESGLAGLIQIRLTDINGQVLPHAPVSFVVTEGGSQLAASTESTAVLTNVLSLPTQPDGSASVYYRTPFGRSIAGGVTVHAGTVSVVLDFPEPVVAINQLPAIALAAPLAGVSSDGSHGIVFAASAFDPDGTITKVEFFADGQKLGESTTEPYFCVWAGASSGEHMVSARATDNQSAVMDAASVTITVIEPRPAQFVQDFEASDGFVAGTWSNRPEYFVSGDNAAAITGETTQSGAQSIVLLPPMGMSSPNCLQVQLPGLFGEQTVRYLDLWLKIPSDSSVVVASSFSIDDSASIGFVRDGARAELQAYKANEGAEDIWTSGRFVPVDGLGVTTQWHRLTIRQDYTRRRLDAYLDGQPALTDLPFIPSSYTPGCQLLLFGHLTQPTYLDHITIYPENPVFADSDGDGLDDAWEVAQGLDVTLNDRQADNDRDGINNAREFVLGTSPGCIADVNNNGLSDRWELQNFGQIGVDASADADGDGVGNGQEQQLGTNPRGKDTDGDGLEDGQELTMGTDPLDPHSNAPAAPIWMSQQTTTTTEYAPAQYVTPGITGVNPQRESLYLKIEWKITRTGSPDADGEYTYSKEYVDSSRWVVNKNFPGWPFAGYALDPYAPAGDSLSSYGFGWADTHGGAWSLRDSIAHTATYFGWMSGSDTSIAWSQPGITTDSNGQQVEYTDTFSIELSKPSHPIEVSPARTVTNTTSTDWFLGTPLAARGQSTVTTSEYFVVAPRGFTGTIRWLEVFTPDDGSGKQYRYQEWAPQGQTKSRRFSLVCPAAGASDILPFNAELAVDANRSGQIRLTSEDSSDATSAESPYRFWINDDIDKGDTDGTDIPAQPDNPSGIPSSEFSANYHTAGGVFGGRGMVNGARDLIDFFPLYLDFKPLLTAFPPTAPGVKYKLKHEEGALNFVYTRLRRSEAFKYQQEICPAEFGDDLDKLVTEADTRQITAKGYELSEQFMIGMRDNDWGVILVEGRAVTDKPLVLSIESNGIVIADIALPLQISPVEQMFRHLNLRNGADAPSGLLGQIGAGHSAVVTNLSEPKIAYPDEPGEAKWLFFVHGYNVSGEKARGWTSEMFKRFYWSGSKARFVGVTWFGNPGTGNLNIVQGYHWAVRNAVPTAAALAARLNGLVGKKTVVGHSQGSWISALAVADYGLNIDNLCLVDAAFARECFDGNAATDVYNMVPDFWQDYPSWLWSANWYQNFPTTDARSQLTWHNRLTAALPHPGMTVHNFYSSTEDVCESYPGTPTQAVVNSALDVITPGEFSIGRYAWICQEKSKGDKALLSQGSDYAGWGFNLTDPVELSDPTYYRIGPSGRRPLIADSIGFVSSERLGRFPVFAPGWGDSSPTVRTVDHSIIRGPSWIEQLYNTAADTTTGSTIAGVHRTELLAEAFPALSLPVGANKTTSLQDNNYDMPELYTMPSRWPRGPKEANGVSDWHHSDIREVAYLYFPGFFKKITTLSN